MLFICDEQFDFSFVILAMKPHVIETVTEVNRPLEEVFAFFSKAENLNLITPGYLGFKILTPLPIEMKTGTHIDYLIRLNGIPIKWKTLISKWDPPYVFIDEQLKGPYSKWVHEHRFEADSNKTIMRDKVEFLSPGRIFEPLIHHLFVKKKVAEIFRYREQKIKEIFP